MEPKGVCIPKLDFSPLESGNTAVWDALQGEMMRALESYGCFEVVYDKFSPELQDAFLGRICPEMFGLPLEVKLLTRFELPTEGSGGTIPQFPYEAFIQVPERNYEGFTVSNDVGSFSRRLWPQGNLTFCDTVSTFNKHMKDLERIIVRLLFLGLGIEKYYDSYTESTIYGTRTAEYGTPLDKESMINFTAHVDPSIISIIGQSLEGLEIQTKEGEWMPIVPSRNSYTVLIGDTIQAWSNGKIQATNHRVRNYNNEKRYSVIFESVPHIDSIIQTPKELVDEEHPLIYKPHVYRDHLAFLYADGDVVSRTLYDFCGISDSQK